MFDRKLKHFLLIYVVFGLILVENGEEGTEPVAKFCKVRFSYYPFELKVSITVTLMIRIL